MSTLTPRQQQGLTDVRRRLDRGENARDVLMDEQLSRQDRAAIAEHLQPGAGADYR